MHPHLCESERPAGTIYLFCLTREKGLRSRVLCFPWNALVLEAGDAATNRLRHDNLDKSVCVCVCSQSNAAQGGLRSAVLHQAERPQSSGTECGCWTVDFSVQNAIDGGILA